MAWLYVMVAATLCNRVLLGMPSRQQHRCAGGKGALPASKVPEKAPVLLPYCLYTVGQAAVNAGSFHFHTCG